MNSNTLQDAHITRETSAAIHGASDHQDEGHEKITLTEARKILGVSPNKMSKLIGDGTLIYEHDPLDQRVKLVKRGDVEKLKQFSRKS